MTFTCSVIGASHVKSGKPMQDASLCDKGEGYSFIAVADGHGGERYFRSEHGSRFAIEAARECVTDQAVIDALEQTLPERNLEQSVLQLKKSIVSRWNILVAEHVAANPFTENELADIPEKYAEEYRAGERVESAYGSTLLALLWADDFLLALQIGDGSCVAVDSKGTFTLPVPADERCFLNTTTSLCDKDAIEEFRHYFCYLTEDSTPAAVLLASDGVDDSFAGEGALYGFYRVILASFGEKDEEAAAAELADYLPRLSAKGSGDDMSLAMIADVPRIRALKLFATDGEQKTENPRSEPDEKDGQRPCTGCHQAENLCGEPDGEDGQRPCIGGHQAENPCGEPDGEEELITNRPKQNEIRGDEDGRECGTGKMPQA